jgi:hypothetical protein
MEIPTARRGPMPRQTVKLPRSSYEELRKIIVGYGKLSSPSGLDEVAQRTGINRTGISDNNAFLAAAGIIEGGKKKGPTSRGQALARALEHEIADEVQSQWSDIVQENDFLKKMLEAVTIRKGMERSQLEAHIAYSAGETRTTAVMTGARAVVDILKASGLVADEDGQITPTVSEQGAFETDVAHREPELMRPSISAKVRSRPGYSIVIQLNINVTPTDLEDLPSRIAEFLEALDELLPRPPSAPTIG